jgi:hypothetical protein
MNHEYCFMAAKAKGNTVTLDAAVIGIEHDCLLNEGAFANILFKRCNQLMNYDIKIQSAKARDNNNRNIPVLINSKDFPASDAPATFGLAQNYPNPFNPTTVIEYSVPSLTARDLVSNGVRDGQLPTGKTRFNVSLKVYDMLGREVATLVKKQQDAGYYRVVWNGMNSQQQPVSSGIYFYQMRAVDPSSTPDHSFINVKKMLFLK